MLIPHFNHRIMSHSITSGDMILCAVSGGIDSMVLLDLFLRANLAIEVMHMNYGLRGESSDADQALVEKICAKHKIKCHTKSVIKPSSVNMQEWARDERYQFINELDKTHKYQYIATAHHKQDQLETVLLSIFKGYSLQTIKTLRGKLIRPLLDFDKQEIINYAFANGIEYRQDQSNFSNDYDRNFLRNEIIPPLRTRFENYDKRVLKFAERQTIKNNIANQLIQEKVDQFSSHETNNLGNFSYLKISLKILEEIEGKNILFSFMLSAFELNKNQLDDLLESEDSSAKIISQNHACQKDQNNLFIARLDAIDIEKNIESNHLDFDLHRLKLKATNDIPSPKNTGFHMVDYDLLAFPLHLRKVQESDKFRAFGLKGGTTSLTKFLKDKGIPAICRLHEYILVDGMGRIIIPGIEIDFVLKITNSSKTGLIIDLQDKTR